MARFAFLVTGDHAAAEDVLQEALTTACARWSRIVRTDDAEAYVRRMIANAHISWWRRIGRRETPVAEVFLGKRAVHEASPSADDRLWQLCRALPPRQRAVIVLRFYEGMSYAEVAAVLGVAEVTARTQTQRALAKLKTRLLEEETDDG